jgi:hypothetical protein
MKKEAWAGGMLLALLILSFLNLRYLDNKISGMLEILDTSRDYFEAGYYDLAEENLDKVIDIWMSSDGYTHIAIRHSEIDSATDAFYDLKSEVAAQNDGAVGAYEKVRAHLDSIYRMERITLGSIF